MPQLREICAVLHTQQTRPTRQAKDAGHDEFMVLQLARKPSAQEIKFSGY